MRRDEWKADLAALERKKRAEELLQEGAFDSDVSVDDIDELLKRRLFSSGPKPITPVAVNQHDPRYAPRWPLSVEDVKDLLARTSPPPRPSAQQLAAAPAPVSVVASPASADVAPSARKKGGAPRRVTLEKFRQMTREWPKEMAKSPEYVARFVSEKLELKPPIDERTIRRLRQEDARQK